MAWADKLLTASFRGVEFDILSTDDEAERALALHEYPYKDGADVEDMGRHARRVTIRAIFFGDDYEDRLQAFIAVLDKPGHGPLVHPVFGNMEKMQEAGYRIAHDADNVDSCALSVDFLESVPSQPFFSSQLASQKADAVTTAASAATEASGNVLGDGFASLVAAADSGKVDALARIGALNSTVTPFLTNLKTETGSLVPSISDPVRAGAGFVSDVASMTQSLIDTAPNETEYLQKYLTSTNNKVDSLLSLGRSSGSASTGQTVPQAQLEADTQAVATHVAVERAAAKAQVAGIVLASEAVEPTMTPTQVETIVNTARESVNDAIEQARARYDVEQAHAIVEPLKTLAYSTQEAGRAVIEARPPMATHTLKAPTPLRLLAHELYGDHDRAGEILRLNNLRMPNALNTGETLNVYRA